MTTMDVESDVPSHRNVEPCDRKVNGQNTCYSCVHVGRLGRGGTVAADPLGISRRVIYTVPERLMVGKYLGP